jgi:hypothetical protein
MKQGGVVVALVVLVIVLVVVALADGDDDDTRCRYRIGGGTATLELPCGLDRGSVRTYVVEHPELVVPDVPTLGPN